MLHIEEVWQKLVYMILFNNVNENLVEEWTSGREDICCALIAIIT